MPKKELVFATSNPNKIREVRELLGDQYNFLSLEDIGCTVELPETRDTFAGNAEQKARYVRDHFGYDCFAEDTGLEVTALNGEPGVYTARYAGPERDADANMAKVLSGLQGSTDRSARFRTVMALILDGETHYFEGVVNGRIAESRRGSKGFGYDPVFEPEGAGRTFAEMEPHEKNPISHRGRALAGLMKFLRSRDGHRPS